MEIFSQQVLVSEQVKCKLSNDILSLLFKPDWEVRIVPSIDKAIIKFLIKKNDSKVFIKLYQCEGSFSTNGDLEKYWEIIGNFPIQWNQAPIRRCQMSDIKKLNQFIEKGLL